MAVGGLRGRKGQGRNEKAGVTSGRVKEGMGKEEECSNKWNEGAGKEMGL